MNYHLLEVDGFITSRIDNISFGGIDPEDHPKYCDVFIEAADYEGKPMTDDQLDELNEDRQFVYDEFYKTLEAE